MSHDLTHLDLFSGIGGFALAAKYAGFRTVGFSEVEPYACRLLAEKFPRVPNLGDVRKRESFTGLGPVTVLTGGYPCQPFSTAGRRGGNTDDRHLWPAMRGIIKVVRPTWIIGENVLGHVTLGLDQVLADLESDGYAAQPFVIPACAVDAGHRRDRVWIIGHAPGHGEPACTINAKVAEWSGVLANPLLQRSERLRDEPRDASPAGQGRTDCETDCEPRVVADSISQRQPGQGEPGQLSREKENRKREADYAFPISQPAVWSPEPDVGRVAYGVPDRTHRLKGLGNAIVPQVVTPFFHWIAQIEKGELT